MLMRIALIATALSMALMGCSVNLKETVQSLTTREVRTATPQRLDPPPPMVHRASARRKQPIAYDEEPYELNSGDRLRIGVFGQENLSRDYAVDGGGFISMPLIGAVEARGLTTFDLENRIAGKLKAKYVKDPKVTVEVQTYRPFFVLGEVRRPGQFPYVNGMTVQTAIAIAGGYTERAKKRSVQMTRRVRGTAVERTVPPTYPVRPGDTINVRERFF